MHCKLTDLKRSVGVRTVAGNLTLGQERAHIEATYVLMEGIYDVKKDMKEVLTKLTGCVNLRPT